MAGKMYLLFLLAIILIVRTNARFGGDGTFGGTFGGGGGDRRRKVNIKASFDQIQKLNKAQRNGDDSMFSSDGVTLIEGDIVATKTLLHTIDQMKVAAEKSENGDTTDDIDLFDAIKQGQWPGAKVYYTYHRPNAAMQRAVNAAIAEYNAKTCIKWIYKTQNEIRSYRNYVTFFRGGGCYSMIGKQSRPQRISLGRGCETKGVAIHEMMHALGFFHEQSRLDRDKHITINWRNMNQRMRYNFEKYRPGQASTLGYPYDKKSVMHYGNYAFSINRRMTIVSKRNSRETLGQRQGLSVIDAKQLRAYYECRGTTGTKPTKKPDPSCKNNFKFCKLLGQYCGKGGNEGSWVKRNCKQQCNLCRRKICKDKSNYCRSWAGAGYCSGKHATYMTNNCPRVCKKCR